MWLAFVGVCSKKKTVVEGVCVWDGTLEIDFYRKCWNKHGNKHGIHQVISYPNNAHLRRSYPNHLRSKIPFGYPGPCGPGGIPFTHLCKWMDNGFLLPFEGTNFVPIYKKGPRITKLFSPPTKGPFSCHVIRQLD